MLIRPEFQVHVLNDCGLDQAKEIAEMFSCLLERLETLIPTPSRERALVVTKLQEAAFFAKRAIAMIPENQKR